VSSSPTSYRPLPEASHIHNISPNPISSQGSSTQNPILLLFVRQWRPFDRTPLAHSKLCSISGNKISFPSTRTLSNHGGSVQSFLGGIVIFNPASPRFSKQLPTIGVTISPNPFSSSTQVSVGVWTHFTSRMWSHSPSLFNHTWLDLRLNSINATRRSLLSHNNTSCHNFTASGLLGSPT